MTTTTLRQILSDRPLYSIAPEATLREAAQLMARHRLGALVVLEGGQLAGILSERDIVFRAVAEALPPEATPVAQVMTVDPAVVGIDEPVSKALAAKLGERFRHLPVVEGSEVVGLLSYRDIPAEYVMLFERFREMSSSRADE